jgi:hypothetical protein
MGGRNHRYTQVAAGRLLFSVDVSARLNAKLAGLFRFSCAFGLSVTDNRRELLIIGTGYLETYLVMFLILSLDSYQ